MQARTIQIALGFIASDTGQKIRDLLEFLIVIATILILASFAVREYTTQTARAQVAEILNLGSTAKVDLVTYRAEYGRWPIDADEAGNATLLPHDHLGRYVARASLRDGGVVDMIMEDQDVNPGIAGGVLSFRLGISSLDSGAPIVSICGRAKPPPGIRASGEDRTSIHPEFLPYICKEH